MEAGELTEGQSSQEGKQGRGESLKQREIPGRQALGDEDQEAGWPQGHAPQP